MTDEQTQPEQADEETEAVTDEAQVGEQTQPIAGESTALDRIESKLTSLATTVEQLSAIALDQEERLKRAETRVETPREKASRKAAAVKAPAPLPDHIIRFYNTRSEAVIQCRGPHREQIGNDVMIQPDILVRFHQGILDIDTLTDPLAEVKLAAIRRSDGFGREVFEDRNARPTTPVEVVAGVRGSSGPPAPVQLPEAPGVLEADLV